MTQFSLPKSPKQVSWPSLRVIWYRSQNWARNPTVTIGIILSVFAAYLILAPVIMMLMDAFTVDFADQARASKLEGELTSYYLNRAMNSPIAKYIFWLPLMLSLSHISEPTRLGMISYAAFCLKKKTPTLYT